MPPSSETTPPGLLSAGLQAIGRPDQVRDFRAGDLIFATGDPGDGLYVIQSGTVQVVAVVAHSESRVLATLGAGDFVGEMAVLDAAPRSASARAETETRALFFSRAEFLELLDRQPHLALNLIRDFSKRMRSLNQKYLDEMMQAELLAAVGRFAGTIVHDFKNPLSLISLAGELACGETATPDQRRKAAGMIAKQVDRMSNMLNEIIEVTRPTGRPANLTGASFASFMQPLAEDLREELAGRRVAFALEGPPPTLNVRLDPQRLSRVFYNLANNAADATGSGGRVTLRFIPEPGALRVELQDNGKGIAPEVASQLFQPFATHGKMHGTGLGLSICKKIIESHGGRIWARSEPGQGATFCFTLPLAE